MLTELAPHYKLGVVTKCSEESGRIAADLLGEPFDVIVTSEQAGFYKPDPEPSSRCKLRVESPLTPSS